MKKTKIKFMKKGISITLCLLMMVTMVTGCAKDSPDTTQGAYKPGTYTATEQGHNGPVTVSVTFDANSITAVNIDEHSETPGVSDPAIERIPKSVVDGQTLAVDTVSGATMTSVAILTAVEDCVTQAGGNVTALKAAREKKNDTTDLTRDTDVLVVGTGIAGMLAAISAADNGAQVLAIDKMPSTGGTSITAGGYFIAADSQQPNDSNIDDSIDSLMTYWHNIMDEGSDTGYPNYDKVRSILGDSGKTVDYMASFGVPFGSIINPFGGTPVAAVEGGGSGMISALEKAARDKGVEFLLECKAEELITDGSGAVTGVKATTPTENMTINAKSVVLATGGFSKNPEMVKSYSPEIEQVVPLAAVSSTGDGIRMAEAVGAARFENYWSSLSGVTISMDYAKAVPEASGLTTAQQLGVNGNGERFACEAGKHHTALTYDLIKDGNYYKHGNNRHRANNIRQLSVFLYLRFKQ